MVENLDLLVTAVVYVHVFCSRSGEKPIHHVVPNIWKAAFSLDPNVAFEVSHSIEDLNPVALSVTDIDQPIAADVHTMYNLHERAAHTRIGLFPCPLMPPLSKKFPGSIENGYAPITITVGHVDIAICGVYRYVGRHVKLRLT